MGIQSFNPNLAPPSSLTDIVKDKLNLGKDKKAAVSTPQRQNSNEVNGFEDTSKSAPAIPSKNPNKDNSQYNIKESNWYKALPYGFRFHLNNGTIRYMFLPISPQNLTIATNFAVNIIAGAYGTIEEHSEQRYFDIVIEGTTGIAPEYPAFSPSGGIKKGDITQYQRKNDGIKGNPSTLAIENTRISYPSNGAISSNIAGGFFGKTIGMANNVLSKVDKVLGKSDDPKIGVKDCSSGYRAFHTLYQFFLRYKEEVIAKEKRNTNMHPIYFLNYKDNNEYKCAIQRFILRRDISNPLLYKYSIVLRGYDLRSLDENSSLFSDGKLTDRLNNLGLGGLESGSLMSKIKDKASAAKNIVGGALGGLSGIGG